MSSMIKKIQRVFINISSFLLSPSLDEFKELAFEVFINEFNYLLYYDICHNFIVFSLSKGGHLFTIAVFLFYPSLED